MKIKSLKFYGCIAIAVVLALTVLLCNFNLSYALAAEVDLRDDSQSQQKIWNKKLQLSFLG